MPSSRRKIGVLGGRRLLTVNETFVSVDIFSSPDVLGQNHVPAPAAKRGVQLGLPGAEHRPTHQECEASVLKNPEDERRRS